MKYIDEFRNKKLIESVASRIRDEADPRRKYRIMEVCGTHTMNIFRFGLKEILPDNIELISGPGCPVCVTPCVYLDKAIWLANLEGVTVAAFGDLLRVPGSRSTLERARASGSSVKIVYSTIDALDMARQDTGREIIFLGIGFETTAPTVAQAILMAKKEGLSNFSVLCGHKTMPEVLTVLAASKGIDIDGFLLPGHVSAIIGIKPYRILAEKFSIGCVVSGFEPLDIMESILMFLRQRSPRIEDQYTRIINPSGNVIARKSISRVFEKVSSEWRGIGIVKKSGLAIRKGFSEFDAEAKFHPTPPGVRETKGCICGAVLKGVARPTDCNLFGHSCTPEHPIGACMVSSEGTCAAYFKYQGVKV